MKVPTEEKCDKSRSFKMMNLKKQKKKKQFINRSARGSVCVPKRISKEKRKCRFTQVP
jgi:hypothetical protein